MTEEASGVAAPSEAIVLWVAMAPWLVPTWHTAHCLQSAEVRLYLFAAGPSTCQSQPRARAWPKPSTSRRWTGTGGAGRGLTRMNGSEMRLSTAERRASEKLPQIAVSGRPDCLRLCLLFVLGVEVFRGKESVLGQAKGWSLTRTFLNDVTWADFDFGAIGGCPWSGSSSSSPDSSRYLLDHDLNWFAPLSASLFRLPSFSPLSCPLDHRSISWPLIHIHVCWQRTSSYTPPAPPPTSPRPCSAALVLLDSRLLPTRGSMRLVAMHARCMPHCGWSCEQVRWRWRAGARYTAGHCAGRTPSTLAICLPPLHSVLYPPAFTPWYPEPYGNGGCPPHVPLLLAPLLQEGS